MIKNNRPYTCEQINNIDDELITDLSKEDMQLCLDWISSRLKPINSVNRKHTSYGLKHLLQRELNIYLTNNQFKDAMMMCGYMPSNPNDLNWYFSISEKSYCFSKKWREKVN